MFYWTNKLFKSLPSYENTNPAFEFAIMPVATFYCLALDTFLYPLGRKLRKEYELEYQRRFGNKEK